MEKCWFSGSAPLLEINARRDPFKPRPHWRELHDQVGDRVATVLIDDAAHALFPEQPHALADAVLPWIEQFRERRCAKLPIATGESLPETKSLT